MCPSWTPPGFEYKGVSQLASDVRMTSVSSRLLPKELVCQKNCIHLCPSALSHNKATPLQQSHPIISNDRQEKATFYGGRFVYLPDLGLSQGSMRESLTPSTCSVRQTQIDRKRGLVAGPTEREERDAIANKDGLH